MRIEKIRFKGDCLAAVGVPSKGIAVIANDEPPRVFDIVWCNNTMGSIGGYLKEIVQTGKNAIVRTRYEDPSRDSQFYARKIYGVVLHVLDDDRNVVWGRPPAIDAVPVVRCKECRSYDHGCCVVKRYAGDDHIIAMKPDDFCSYGERKEDEQHE